MSQVTFMGRGTKFQTGSNVTLKHGSERVQLIQPTVSVIDVTLPDATELKKGGPIFYVINNAVFAYFLQIKDNDGNVLTLFGKHDAGILFLLDNSTSAGVWSFLKMGLV